MKRLLQHLQRTFTHNDNILSPKATLLTSHPYLKNQTIFSATASFIPDFSQPDSLQLQRSYQSLNHCLAYPVLHHVLLSSHQHQTGHSNNCGSAYFLFSSKATQFLSSAYTLRSLPTHRPETEKLSLLHTLTVPPSDSMKHMFAQQNSSINFRCISGDLCLYRWMSRQVPLVYLSKL